MPGATFAELFERSSGQAKYNEIVLDASFWRANMPLAVEAVVGDANLANGFITAFGLDREAYPLLTLDPRNFERPFRAAVY